MTLASAKMDALSLSVNFFGPTIFRCEGKPLAIGLKGTTLELLWYLMINAGVEIRRETIADQFWEMSSEARQRSALNSAIWRIGKKLPSHSGLNLNTTDSTLCMTIDEAIPVDSRDLCRLVQQACAPGGLDQCCADRLGAALAACEAPFMDGIDADWALAERERISVLRMRGMIALMHWHGDARNYEEALRIGRKLLGEDPFRETVQIDVMWLYVLNGQRARAIRQYDDFVVLLREELAIEAMPETRALYDHIRNGMDVAPVYATEQRTQRPLFGDNRRDSLSLVLAAVEQSRREIYQTLRTQLS